MEPFFIYEAKGQTLIIHTPAEMDHHSSRNLRYETDLLMAENYISKLIFDFSRTTFMDSSGIGILLNRYKQIKASGGTVSFYGASSQIRRILKLGGMLTLMPQFESKEEAIYR
jgi:stage II sporulation protein AA (anti-sigma F factor antagonist)